MYYHSFGFPLSDMPEPKFEIKKTEEIDRTKHTCELPGCGDSADFMVTVGEIAERGSGVPYLFCLWHRDHALNYHAETVENETNSERDSYLDGKNKGE